MTVAGEHILLFVQGGGDGAHAADADVVRRLQTALGETPTISFPEIDGLDNLDWTAAQRELGAALKTLSPRGGVVAHSVGASAMLRLLATGTAVSMAHLFLLAPPYNGADGEWGDTDFSFPADFADHLPPHLAVTLWHCRDDQIIPVANAERYRQKMLQAEIHIRDHGGHQFGGSLSFLADAIRGALQ